MTTRKEKLQAMDSFNNNLINAYFDSISTLGSFPESITIDRWELLEICRLLRDYRKELATDAKHK